MVVVAIGALTLGAALIQPPQPRPFWDAFLRPSAMDVEHYESLREIVRAADAVILGRFVSIEPGREFGEPGIDVVHYAAATVAIDVVLAGSAVDPGPSIILELQLPHGMGADDARTLEAQLPRARHIFFVRNKGLEVARAGLAGVAARERPFYRTVTSDAFLVETQGLVDAPGVTEADSILLALEGRPFGDVVSSIRQCAVAPC